jgi:glycerophosphoryl diester phosphodiesterase
MRKFRFIILFSLACLFASCKKEAVVFNIDNMENKVQVLGHGGMGISNFYPMNSAESIMSCINLGADGTEMDIQMTKDSVLVAYHDETLETQTDGHGAIIDYTWEDLQKVKYTAAPYIGYAILSIENLFAHLDNLHQLTFSFDNKLYFDAATQVVFRRAIIRLLEKYQMESNVFIESHDLIFLSAFKSMKDYKYFLNPDNFETGLALADSLGLYGIIMDDDNITGEQIALAHQHGKYVQTWGPVTRNENAEAIHKNPDAIQTNNVHAMMELLK